MSDLAIKLDDTDDYPKCPDCHGSVIWAEAGNSSGTCMCKDCDSYFADSAHHAKKDKL